jgi:hypothetical protein
MPESRSGTLKMHFEQLIGATHGNYSTPISLETSWYRRCSSVAFNRVDSYRNSPHSRLYWRPPKLACHSQRESFVILFDFVWLFAVARWPSKGPTSRRAASVELLTPLNHAQLGARRNVAGSVWPPNTKVQVFVMPGDGWWYTQGERRQATVDDSSWNVECTFGTPDTGLGSNYQIIAIANANIKESRISALPSDGIRSEIIKVRRSK